MATDIATKPCPKCGHMCRDDELNCPSCGARVRWIVAKATAFTSDGSDPTVEFPRVALLVVVVILVVIAALVLR